MDVPFDRTGVFWVPSGLHLFLAFAKSLGPLPVLVRHNKRFYDLASLVGGP